jgi:hypothetical protein
MELPNLKKFLDIKDRAETLGPPKTPDTDVKNLGAKNIYITWEAEIYSGGKTLISKRFARSSIIIGVFVGILLLIMQEFALILAIGSIVFFLQVYSKMLPQSIRFEISNYGIMIGDNLYPWDKLRRYFFFTRDGNEVIGVDTVLGFPGRIFINFEIKDKEKIKEILDKNLYYLESEPRTFLDNAYDKIMSKFNVEEKEDFSDKPETHSVEKTDKQNTPKEE